jgi:hypothetical protein
MQSNIPDRICKMRALAMQLRAQATETHLALYQHKFHVMAVELEETARDLECRTIRAGFRLAS